MNSQAEILNDLFSKWVSLALEYSKGAPDLRAIYVYASSERGWMTANVYFDQSGSVEHGNDLSGVDNSVFRFGHVQRIILEDLEAAEVAFKGISIPAPTEYRVYFEPATGKLDTQLSRELIYANSKEANPARGIEYWLGDRAPNVFGTPLPSLGDNPQPKI